MAQSRSAAQACGSRFRVAVRAIVLGVLLIAFGCGGGTDESSLGQVSEAVSLTSDQTRILGFESAADWSQTTGSAALALSADHVDLNSSLRLTGVINTKLKSVTFAPISAGFSSVDIWVKNSAVNASVAGTVTLGINGQTGEPVNGVLGQASLQAPSTSFQKYTFAVPPWINDALGKQGSASVYLTVGLAFSQASTCEVDAITPQGAASDRKTPPFPAQTNPINPSVPPGATNAPGRVPGTSSVDGNGAFTYRIPIAVPPGRAGMEPHLALSYSSAGGNGPLGVGWNIEGTSSITRCRKFIAREGVADSIKVKLFPNDNPADQPNNFCLDGEKLVEIDETADHEFRTERDKFARIVATWDAATDSPSKFVVQRRDGTIATYLAGTTFSGVDSRDPTTGQPNGNPFSGVLAWPLTTEEDRFGNGVTYTYAPGDDGSAAQILSTVTYTTCADGSACPYGGETRLVQFNYEARTDYISHWIAGLNAGMSVRLNSIDISTLDSGDQHLVRSYKLGYDTSGATARSRLTTLSQCDGTSVADPLAAGAPCFAPMVFHWGADQGADFRRSWHVIGPDPAGTVSPGQCSAGGPAPGCFHADYTLDTDAVTSTSQSGDIRTIDASPEPLSPGGSGGPGGAFLIGDFDGNGTDDIVTLVGNLTGGQTSEDDFPHGVLYLTHPANGSVRFEKIRINTSNADVGFVRPNYELARAFDVDQDGQMELLIPDERLVTNGDGSRSASIQLFNVYQYNSFTRDFVQKFRDDNSAVVLSTPARGMADRPTLLDVNGDGVLDYFYDTRSLVDTVGHAFKLAVALPSATSLFPDGYTTPVEISYFPAPEDQAKYLQGLCRLQPIDFAGHGYRTPATVCDDSNTQTFFADLNGDGLSDILKVSSSAQALVTARLSTGLEVDLAHVSSAATAPEGQALPPINLAGTEFAATGTDRYDPFHNEVIDFNNDGLADIVQFKTATRTQPPGLWLSRGAGFDQTRIAQVQLPYTGERFGDITQHVGDFNGDGLPDIVQGTHFTIDSDVHTGVRLQFLIQDPSNREDVITRVSSDFVDLATLTFKATTTSKLSPEGADGAPLCANGSFCPRRGLNVVAETTVAENGTLNQCFYFYREPVVDSQGRGFLGFHSIVKAEPLSSTMTTTIYDNARLEGVLHGYHVYPYAFTPSSVSTLTGAAALDTIDALGSHGAPPSAFLETRSSLLEVSRRLHLLHSLNGHLSSASTFFVEEVSSSYKKKVDPSDPAAYFESSRAPTYDDFGNLTVLDRFDGPEQTTETVHYNNDGGPNWLIGKPDHAEIVHLRDGPPETFAPTIKTYTYGSFGELTGSTTTLPLGSQTQTSATISRDAAGLITNVVTSDQFGNERAASYEYSADGVYRQHIQDALGHDTWIKYDSGLAVPVSTVDANGSSTLYSYDGFGHAIGISPTRAPAQTIAYSQAAGALTVTTTDETGARNEKHFDSLGNVFSTVTNVAGQGSVVLYGRDLLGRLSSKTVPHDPISEPGQREIYQYDNLNQLRFVTHHDGSTVSIDRSDPLTVDITEAGIATDSRNPSKHTVINKTEDGLVSSVRETAASGPVAIRGVDYVYGQGQELEQVIELGGPTTSYTYLGQPKPVTVTDSEHGQTTIQYDGFNQVRHVQHDPAYPSTIDNEYDSLGRLTRVVTAQPDPNTPTVLVNAEARYVYDNGQGAIGQRSFALSPDGVATTYAYTPEGLPSEVRFDSPFGSYSIDTTYDALGRASHLDYPDAKNRLPRFGVDLTYNDSTGGGDLQEIDGTPKSITRGTDTFWAVISRELGGVADQAFLAGNLTQSIAVDAATRRITGIAVSNSQSAVYDIEYTYFNGGNLETRTDNLTATDDNYTYDAFDQLATWSSTGPSSPSESYVYDALGNQQATGVASNVFGGTGFSPHQIATRTKGTETRAFQYDPLGRQTSMQINGATARTVTYTPFNLPKQIHISSPLPGFPNHSYSYDADQQKVHEDDGTNETTYVGSLYERRINKATCKIDDVFYVYAEGQRVAQIVQSHDGTFCLDSNTGKGTTHLSPKVAVETLSALHSDLQGTVTGATAIGASPVTTRQAFSPWGERLPVSAGSQSSPIAKVTVGFTDQEQDDTVGLVNMRGRMYDAITRTFLTPDPIVGSPLTVSGWNKYAYVLNNPLKYTDPSGFDAEVIGDTVLPGEGDYTTSVSSDGQSSYDFFIQEQSDDGVAPTTSHNSAEFDPGECSDSHCSPASASASSGESREDRDWDAAKSGLWNAYVDQVENVLNITDPVHLIGGGGLDLGFLKSAPPSDARDRQQYDFANSGATFLAGALGILTGGEAPAEKAVADLAADGAGSVALDTNAVIAAVERGQGAAVLGGRTPVVSITAVKEFLRGGGSTEALRGFLSANGGRVGPSGSEASVGALRTQAAVGGRALGVGDARVAASAQREGLSVITQDRSFRNFLNWVGIGGENF